MYTSETKTVFTIDIVRTFNFNGLANLSENIVAFNRENFRVLEFNSVLRIDA